MLFVNICSIVGVSAFGVGDNMVRNKSYNGYGSYFVPQCPSISTRTSNVNDWVEVKKLRRSAHNNVFNIDKNSRNWNDCRMDTHFPLSFLYDSDDDDEDYMDESGSSDDNDDETYSCKRSIERERHFALLHENSSNTINVDEEGDVFPGLDGLNGDCNDVLHRDYDMDDCVIPRAKHLKKDSHCDKRTANICPEVDVSSGNNVVGTRVAKEFKQVLHMGIVTKYLPPISVDDDPWWQIVYDDNDEEQWDISELNDGISLFKNVQETQSILEVNPSNSISCVVSSDSEDSMEWYVESDDDESDYVPSSGDECEDSVSTNVHYVYRQSLFYNTYVFL